MRNIMLCGVLALACSEGSGGFQMFVRLVQLDRLQAVGVTPVKKVTAADGTITWQPACYGPADALRLDFNLQSTIEGDSDLQIHPGQDAVGPEIVTIGKDGLGPANFDLDLECLQPQDGIAAGPACTGQSSPSSQIVPDGLLYVDHVAGAPRHTPVGVAILIDQSASILGTVDQDTCLEGKAGAFDQIEDISNCQSDHAGLRLTAAKSLLATLNPGDPAIVFAFNEVDGCQVVCDPGIGPGASEALKLEACYSTDRSLVLPTGAPGAIDLLQGTGKGRSNLWSCVTFVHEFMQTKGEAAKHIVVLTDGADTCAPDSEDFQHCFTNDADTTVGSQPQEACSGAKSFSDARAIVEGYGKGDLHVSFVQFQSKGYPQADGRMTQAACLTGGHHIFLNFNSISESFGGERRDAILDATTRIRNTFSGHWALVADLPAVADLAGGQYALAGTLQMTAPKIKESIAPVHFAWGGITSITPPALPNTDSRLTLVKPCTVDADCAGATSDPCGMRCSPSSGLCLWPANGAGCQGGICCEGSCQAGKTLCADTTKGMPGDPGPCP